jgi:hypothetical protein
LTFDNILSSRRRKDSAAIVPLDPMQRETHRGGMDRAIDDVHQPANASWRAQTNRQTKGAVGHIDRAGQKHRTARGDNSRS